MDTSSQISEVFISYSSEDKDSIEPIVKLIRAMKKNSVFQDFYSIRLGEKWEDAINKALTHCKTIIVFWCEHSKKSRWVRREYEAGIEFGKEIIPIRLDDTSLLASLGAYQGLDFRRKDDTHAGIHGFTRRRFQRSRTRHFNPRDDKGDIRDWEWEGHHQQELEREVEWKVTQEKRTHEIAHEIVSLLNKN